MKKHLRVLGVLVCLLPLMTGCLPQTKVKQESSSSHKTSQTSKKETSSSSSSESQGSETSSSRAAASHAPVTKGVAGEQTSSTPSQPQTNSNSYVGQTVTDGMDFYYHLAVQVGICAPSVSPDDFYREATIGDQSVTYQGRTVTVKRIHEGEGAYEQDGKTVIDKDIYEIVSVN
ncbi:hypothetical protein [Ligilactobacillus animalis]|uniref:hypothetical protein n=1 Tax=Ligilactobacillus animalis TaxID=1605 RepID=UPI0008259BE6|nr:hypothetical protein [Ligilactobacillus animalis]OCX47503.1 hypothetical protein BFC98_08070 [Ligilactobacillus animalis]QHQ69473.1 hypothetical protein GSR62_01435 [Ligilactobacillus animalis]